MEINEKLEIFSKAVIKAATTQGESILDEQKNAYQSEMSAYREKKQKMWEARERVLEEKVRKEVNRQVSGQMMVAKRSYHDAEEAKKDQLFALVEKKLKEYAKTENYYKNLCATVRKIQKDAGSEEVTFYLSADDEGLKGALEKETGCTLTLTDEHFCGGIRAVIPRKNVLYDETFATRLAREREQFVFSVS
jgi:vacuolar-type H+-ATPase subunit E/Vma4